MERLVLRNKVKEEEILQIYGRLREYDENVFAPPNRLRENAETAISGRGSGLPERRKRCTSSREQEEDA